MGHAMGVGRGVMAVVVVVVRENSRRNVINLKRHYKLCGKIEFVTCGIPAVPSFASCLCYCLRDLVFIFNNSFCM